MLRNLLLLLLVLHAECTVNTTEIEENLEHFLEELVGSEFLQRKFNVDSDLFESSEDFVATDVSESRRKRALGWRTLFGNNDGGRNGRQGFGGVQNFGAGAQNLGGLGLAGVTYNLINTIRLLSQGLGLGYLERVSAVVKEVDTYDCIPRAICEYTANQTYQTRQAELRENEKKSENRTDETTTTERPWYTRFAPRPENMPQYLTVLRALNIDQTNSFHIIRPAMFGVHKADVSECVRQYKECNGSYSDAFIDTVNNMEGGIVGALGRIGTLLGIGTGGLNGAAPGSTADLFSAAGLGSLPGAGLAGAGQAAAALAANGLGAQAANPFGFTQQQLNSLTPQQQQYYQQLLLAQQQQAQQAALANQAAQAGAGNFISLSPFILRGVNAIRGAFGNRNRQRPANFGGVPTLQDLVLDSDDLDPNDFDFESRNINQVRGSRGIVHKIPNRFDTGDPHPNAIPQAHRTTPHNGHNAVPYQNYGPAYQGHYGGRPAHPNQPGPPPAPQIPRQPTQNGKPVPYHTPSQGRIPESVQHPIFRTTTPPSWRFLTSQEQSDPTRQPSFAPHPQAVNSIKPAHAESRIRPPPPARTPTGKVLFRD